ncbi:MAG: ACT domain-containing protein [Anaerolineae bacterium]|nr:ACT domain-containing protein [Anaerolineae bacterium]
MAGITLTSAALAALPLATLGLLADTEVCVLPERVAIVGLAGGAREALAQAGSGLMASLDDGEELTLIVREGDLARLQSLWPEAQTEAHYRLVKLVATLPWNTVGYGAAIAAALAEAKISVGFLSGYTTDYLLVRQADLETACAALAGLVREAGRRIV